MNIFLRAAFYLLAFIVGIELFLMALVLTNCVVNELFFMHLFIWLLSIDVALFVIGFFLSLKTKS